MNLNPTLQEKAFKDLQEQLATMTKERDNYCTGYYDQHETRTQFQRELNACEDQLAASQAREAKLLDFAIWMSGQDVFGTLQYFIDNRYLLALPQDRTALDELLKGERERCAKVCDDHPDNLGAGNNFSTAIRNMK